MKGIISLLCLLTFSSQAGEVPVTGEGALFFDRGHYWIELAFYDSEGKNVLPHAVETSQFTVQNLAVPDRTFKPSRVELLERDGGGGVVILSSGRLKGVACYRVTFRSNADTEMTIDSICDPFHFVPGEEVCASKSFFRRYIASAFSRSGDIYNLNQFRYEYDLSAEKTFSNLSIQPCFNVSGWEIEPAFEQRRTVYYTADLGKVPVNRRALGVTLSKSSWVKEIRVSLSAEYHHERSILSPGDMDSTVYAQSAKVGFSVRLDNFFDSVNRYCFSVFKGMDLGFGYAWYQSNDEEVWGSSDFESMTPYLAGRVTWTFIYGFQLSYLLESYWPSSLHDRFEEFHSLRFRLLLRDVLQKEPRKPYHPDLELAFDEGRRLPLFEREKKVSIGFTFDLFPW